jgi:hypothetical protein
MNRSSTLFQDVLRFALILACVTPLSACADADPRGEPEGEPVASDEQAAGQCAPTPPIDPARSLLVTDPAVLAKFPLQTVLTKILTESGTTGQTALELYRRWWDSQNTSAGAAFPDAIHCDDKKTPSGQPAINGFPIQCPRNEGALATSNPFLDTPLNLHFMKVVAVVNRFDLAALDGSHCGEYRIIYAKRSGEAIAVDRNLVIFEAQLPNPKPACGLAGCRPVAEFWASLSAVNDPAARAAAIEDFYFNGLDGFDPVLLPENLGVPADGKRRGQIRTNQFMAGTNEPIWQLREFQLNLSCAAAGCRLFFEPVALKNNPFGPLFNVTSADPRRAAFQSAFLDQVAPLAPQDVNSISMATADTYNAGQSNSQTASTQGLENDYSVHLLLGGLNNSFMQSINAKLSSMGRTDLNAVNIADRATTQSCGGCHELSSGDLLGGTKGGAPFTWPLHTKPFSFVHVDESSQASKPLAEVFLPHRKQILQSYLASTPCNGCGGEPAQITAASDGSIPGTGAATLGGSFTH